jgi:hypothetical protein
LRFFTRKLLVADFCNKIRQEQTFLLVCGSLSKLELLLLWSGGPP